MPRPLVNTNQQAHLKEVLSLIDEKEMSTQWTLLLDGGKTVSMATSGNRHIRPSDPPSREDIGLYEQLGLVSNVFRALAQIQFSYVPSAISNLIERNFYEPSNGVLKYPLNEHQMDYLNELAPMFEAGMSPTWNIFVGGDRIIGVMPMDDTGLQPSIPTMEDIYAFADAQLLELRTDPNGRILLFRFRKEYVLYAVRHAFELHPLHQTGSSNMSIVIGGNNYGGNIGMHSRFENIVGNVNVGTALPDSMKAQLEALFKQLGEELRQIPDEYSEAKAAIEMSAEDISKAAGAVKPNSTRLKISIEGLKQAAKNVGQIAPTIVDTATKIALVLTPLLNG